MNAMVRQVGLGFVLGAMLGGCIVSIACDRRDEAVAGGTAPNFMALASDGRQYARDDAMGKGMVLYFIKSDCPINADAIKYFNALGEAYKGKVTYLGVINGDAETYKTWQNQFKAPFPVLFDPDLKIIDNYEAECSPWVILLDKNGAIERTWEGYSAKMLDELNASMANLAGVEKARLAFKGAPDWLQSG